MIAKVERNIEIVLLRRQGESLCALARRYGISRKRVKQIVEAGGGAVARRELARRAIAARREAA